MASSEARVKKSRPAAVKGYRRQVKDSCKACKVGLAENEKLFVDKFFQLKSKSKGSLHCDQYFTKDDCDSIKRFVDDSMNDWVPITFDGNKGRYQKFIGKQVLTELDGCPAEIPACLQSFFKLLAKVHPTTTHVDVRLLKSDADSAQQEFHTDDGHLSSSRTKRKAFANMSFSAIVALEDNENPTKLVVGRGSKKPFYPVETVLKQGDIYFFRGDFPHCGASYAKENIRLFLTTGTAINEHDGETLGVFDDSSSSSSSK